MMKREFMIANCLAVLAAVACSSSSSDKPPDAPTAAADAPATPDAAANAPLGASCTPNVTTSGPAYPDATCALPLICSPAATSATTGTCQYALCPTAAPTSATLSTLADVSAHLFQTACKGCHGGAAPKGGLDLSSTDLTALQTILLMTRTSSAVAVDEQRVKPGDADNSLLIHKLMVTGTAADAQFGYGMPRTLPGSVCPETIAALRTWINAGSGTTLP